MEKALSVTSYVLFFLYGLLPVGTLLASLFGYTFRLSSYTLFAVLTALGSIVSLILIPYNEDKIESNPIKALFALLPLSVVVNWFFYIIESANVNAWVIVICMLICFGCSTILSGLIGKPVILKVISIVLLFLAVLPITGCTFVALTFANIGVNTVVETIPSPEGTYYAEVVDSDQGALGGDTIVRVRQNKGFDALIFSVRKTPRRVYMGEWRAYEGMKIYWKDEHCLVINSVEHEIK